MFCRQQKPRSNSVDGVFDVAFPAEIIWQESGGPKVSPPTRAGFGTALISRGVPYDLGGESDVEYAVNGVRARFLLPRS